MSDDRPRRKPPQRPRRDTGENDPTLALVPDRARDLLRQFGGGGLDDDELGDGEPDPAAPHAAAPHAAAPERTAPTPADAGTTPKAEDDAPATVAVDPKRVSDLLRSSQVTSDLMAVPDGDEDDRETGARPAFSAEPPRGARPRRPSPMETTTANFQPNLLNRYNYDEMDRVSTRLAPDAAQGDEDPADIERRATHDGHTDRSSRGPVGDSDAFASSEAEWGRRITEAKARPSPRTGDSGEQDAADPADDAAGRVPKRRPRKRDTEPGAPGGATSAIEALLRAYLDNE